MQFLQVDTISESVSSIKYFLTRKIILFPFRITSDFAPRCVTNSVLAFSTYFQIFSELFNTWLQLVNFGINKRISVDLHQILIFLRDYTYILRESCNQISCMMS